MQTAKIGEGTGVRKRRRNLVQYTLFDCADGVIDRAHATTYTGKTCLDIVRQAREAEGHTATPLRLYLTRRMARLAPLGIDGRLPDGVSDTRLAFVYLQKLLGCGAAVCDLAQPPRPSSDTRTPEEVRALLARARARKAELNRGKYRIDHSAERLRAANRRITAESINNNQH